MDMSVYSDITKYAGRKIMSFYTTAIEGLPGMLLNVDDPIGNFKRKRYPTAFEAYYEQHLVTLEALENGYQQVIDKEQYLANMAEAVAAAAEETLMQEKKKNKRANLLVDYNLSLVVYLYPAVLKYEGESGKPFSEKLAAAWKEHFPDTNVSPATYEQINGGFKRKFCYITTAACTTLGKPDDCYELNCFRNYRDTYLLSTDEGEAIVQEYYDIAPTIVKHINRDKKCKEIYASIWEEYLALCLHLIEEDRKEDCQELYTRMVRNLEKEYFYKS